MSSSRRVIRPIPLRTRVGAMCEIRPPAPMHRMLLLENSSWSKPAILRWRSSAPAIALPRNLIEVCETVDARFMFFSSFSVDLDFQVVVQPHEAHKAVAAEDGHECHVPGALQALLKVLVSARRMRGVSALSRVTVKVCQQPVFEPLQLDKQTVGGARVGCDPHHAAFLVSKFGPLVEHQHTFNLRPCHEKELLVPVGSELLKALVQEQRTDRIAPEPCFRLGRGLGRDSVEALQELVDPLNLPLQARRSFAPSRGLSEARNQVFTPIHKRGSLFFKMCRFHCS